MSKAVLVVEDEYLIAMDIQRLLVSQGWQVIGPAGSVRQAMLLIEQALPVAAILDVNLGGDLVTPVAEALAARGIPFAVASAIDSPERLGGEVLAGAPNAGKPITERRLRAIMAEMLGPQHSGTTDI